MSNSDDYLREIGYEGQINDDWFDYFDSMIIPEGSWNDRMFEYLSRLNLEGSLPDMLEVWNCGDVQLPSLADGLTVTQTYSPGSSILAGAVNRGAPCVFRCSFKALRPFNGGMAGGIIFELGGSGVGAYAGFRSDARFVSRGGNGAAPWNPNTGRTLSGQGEVFGDGELIWEINPGTPISSRAWWNGVQISGQTDGGSSVDWAGVNDGEYLLGANNNVVIGETSYVVDYGTASDLEIFENQVIP